MVQSIDKIDVAKFPDVMRLDKYVLAIQLSGSNYLFLSIMYGTYISLLDNWEYAISFCDKCLFDIIETPLDVREKLKPKDDTGSLSFSKGDCLLFVADSIDELYEFAENVVSINNFTH